MEVNVNNIIKGIFVMMCVIAAALLPGAGAINNNNIFSKTSTDFSYSIQQIIGVS